MRLIRPYGHSHVKVGSKSRRLRLRPSQGSEDPGLDISEFASENPKALIAQWISTIDKIATKPSGRGKPSKTQLEFRERLGNAAWSLLCQKGLLNEPSETLEALWKRRIAPYGASSRQFEKEPNPKGRWYQRFASDDVEVKAADVNKIAQGIYQHLHDQEYRLSSEKLRKDGRISARAQSITCNVLQPPNPSSTAITLGWAEDDRAVYMHPGDVAQSIYKKAAEAAGQRHRLRLRLASEILYQHYGVLFRDEHDNVLSVADAKEFKPGLFALHEAIKACYTKLLKHSSKELGRRVQEKALLRTLPENADALMRRVESMHRNVALSARVRLGKVLHYESGGELANFPGPEQLSTSHYWGSAGQAEIKRNEAFVRIWRQVLALAQRTLTDWADPEGKIDVDILGRIGKIFRENTVDEKHCENKLRLLLGERARLFSQSNSASGGIWTLRFALYRVKALRNSVFHFKGFGDFLDDLKSDSTTNPHDESEVLDKDQKQLLQCLWKSDNEDRAQRRISTLDAAHLPYFLDQKQVDKLHKILTETEPASLPLPRFARMLIRAENTWGKQLRRLPPRGTRTTLETPAVLCRYVSLKMLYEGPFRAWVETCDRNELNKFIDKTHERASSAARKINGGGGCSDAERDLIVARAAHLGNISEHADIWSYFHDLTRETASEMRVQCGYESNPVQARKQAGFIEDFKCEFLACALDYWLGWEGFDFLTRINEKTQMPDDPLSSFEPISVQSDDSSEHWQHALYFLMHLVPVEAVGRLLHQIRKWRLMARAGQADESCKAAKVAKECEAVLALYLDMHDAKFEGGEAMTGVEDFSELFQHKKDFEYMFPSNITSADGDQRVPRRSLREAARFGHLPILKLLCAQHGISRDDVEAFKQAENSMDVRQHHEKREQLHKKWVKERCNLDAESVRAYVESLTSITEHHHRVAQVTLTDHMHAYRLMVDILGRLVDFAGLWERDIYFTTLALIHEVGKTPKELLGQDGIEKLGKGLIIEALRDSAQGNSSAKKVHNAIKELFGSEVWERLNCDFERRKDIMHFNFLRKGKLPNLTECVNEIRHLMKYDRKLKNAVSKAVRELVAREGIELHWEMRNHNLVHARVDTQRIPHLRGIRLTSNKKPSRPERQGRPEKFPLEENLHGDIFVEMIAQLFGGEPKSKGTCAVPKLDLNEVDWSKLTSRGNANAGPRR